jgi:hypothetical protein
MLDAVGRCELKRGTKSPPYASATLKSGRFNNGCQILKGFIARGLYPEGSASILEIQEQK